MKRVLSSCRSIRGNFREKNQDRAICMVSSGKKKVFAVGCVCDGIGSLEMSELASELVTDGIKRWFISMEDKACRVPLEDLLEDLEGTVNELNELVYEYREENNIAIGCTMSLLLAIGMEYFIFHVGDSRIYLVGDNMYQLTVDEVLVKNKEGRIKSYLINYIGKSRTLWMNRTKGSIHVGSLFILGTDGLFKKLAVEDIGALRGKMRTDKDIESMNDHIIQLVLSRGEKDNISSILLYIPN